MNAHNPFDAKQDWTNPYCQNSSNDPMVDALLGNAYHVVRTVYCNLGNLKLLYDFLNQYGMVIGVQSEAELKALTADAKYARIYGFSRTGDRQVTDYLYVEGDRTGIIPDDPEATGSWVTVATSGSNMGGTSSGEGAYIPWVYSKGSATGGETTINVPDGTVGVPFIIVNGDMRYVGRGFEFNVDSLSVTLAQPLEEGDEVVFLLTGVPAVPDNPNVNDWVQINWLYNNGAAVGGEQAIAIPYTFQSIPAVYKNGLRLYKGLTTESYTADPDNQRIFLTEPLSTNDRLIVQIGGEARVLEASDHTLQEVARAANVKDSEVILSTDTTQVLNGKKIVYDVVAQRIYGLPTLPTNVYINSVSNGQLTYSPGNITVALLDSYQQYIGDGSQLSVLAAGSNTPRILADRFADVVNVKDFGAKGDGVTDDTTAFELLETETTGRVIDLGGRSYVVTKSFTKNNYINGSFIRAGSHRVAIGDLKARDKQLPLVHSGMSKTYNARHTLRRTEGAGGIFAAIQGCCYDEINDKIFTLSSTSARGYCINSFAVTNAGELGSYDRTRSPELGHQGLGLHHLPDGNPVLWTSKPHQDGAADQCVSMENILSYTGTTNNVTSGFTTWQIFPASTDSASSTPAVSSCQNYLIAKKIASDGLICTVRVFDLKVMWANRATKTDYSEDYLVEFSYQKPSVDSFTQSIACDGTFIYILESHSYTGMSNFIYVFELTGRFVERVDITTVGDAEAIADNTGTPVYKEPESLTVIKTEAGYVLTIGVCTPVGVIENGKNVYLFDLGCSGSVVQSKASRSVASKTGLHGAGSPNYKYGVKKWNNTFHWTVQPTRKGIQTNCDNPVLFLDGGITGGIQLASNGSEGMSNSWASRHDNATEGPRSILLKSRSGQVSSDVFGAVQVGDRLGTRVWAGDTGTKLVQAAHIKCNVMGAPTADAVPTALYFGTTTTAGAYGDRWVLTEAGHWRPSGTGIYDIGTSSNAVRNMHIVNSPIITSSRKYKRDETPLSEAELRVGLAVYPLIKKFRMKSAYAEKGDAARYHVGIIAEDIQSAFEAEGLDAFAYGILCFEKWDNEYEAVYAKRYITRNVVVDEETQQVKEVIEEELYDTGEKRLVTPAGGKLSVRTDELMFLAMQALHQQREREMDSILKRLSALESQ